VSSAPESLSTFIKKRLHDDLPTAEASKAHRYMMALLTSGTKPPLRVGGPDWRQIEKDSGIDGVNLNASKPVIKSLLELLAREIDDRPRPSQMDRIRERVRALEGGSESGSGNRIEHTPDDLA
jgi:hypothetical protein